MAIKFKVKKNTPIKMSVENGDSIKFSKTEDIVKAVSPIVTVEKTDDGYILVIKDVTGTKETYVKNTTDYEILEKKPRIEGVELIGDKSFSDLGELTITNSEIKDIIDKQFKEVFGGE